MRGELGRIEQDGDAAPVRLRADVLDRGQPAGDVRRAGHGEEGGGGAVIEHGHHVGRGEGALGPALDPAPLGDPGPGQQVGVVLDHGGGDDGVGAEAQPVGQVVDGLGGVAHQHGHVVGVAVPVGEAVGAGPGAS